MAATDAEPIEVPDTPWVWLAIHADAFVVRDTAYRRRLQVHKDKPYVTQGETARLQIMRNEWHEAYTTLVATVTQCEAIRNEKAST